LSHFFYGEPVSVSLENALEERVSGVDRMTRLAQALDHLDVALQRLEQAIDSRERHSQADRSQLESELNALRAAHTALQGEARSVYSRIDQIIARLKTAVEI
jgi:FtsZ-binding cell division protein ZapB